jgi:TMEM175 potassium channel family protein
MQEADGELSSLVRLVAFSDGVFAFAATLLVIVFPFQALPRGPFWTQLLALKGSFLVYLVSFYSIGAFLLAHHRYFRYIKRFDTGLFFLNLAVLLLIAVLPFPTYLLAHDRFSSDTAAFYAGLLSLVHLLYLLLWWYASAGHRMPHGAPPGGMHEAD